MKINNYMLFNKVLNVLFGVDSWNKLLKIAFFKMLYYLGTKSDSLKYIHFRKKFQKIVWELNCILNVDSWNNLAPGPLKHDTLEPLYDNNNLHSV